MAKEPPREYLARLAAARPMIELADLLRAGDAAAASGLWGSAVAAVTAVMQKQLARPVVLVCGHIDEADDLADDVELFLGRRPEVLPALELSGALGTQSEEQVANRMQLVWRLAEKKTGVKVQGSGNAKAPSSLNPEPYTLNPPLIVAPIQALMQPVPSRKQLAQLVRELKKGQELEPEKLIVWLSEHGYNRLEQVEVPGDFAVRGGIIDIYLPGEFDEDSEQVGLTVRVDFFGDQIESIKRFSIDSLGSLAAMESVRLIDLKGKLDDLESVNLLSHLPEETLVVLWAPLEIAEQSKSYLDRLPEAVKGIYPLSAVLKNAERFTRLELSQFDQGATAIQSLVGGKNVPGVRLPVRSVQKFETEARAALVELAEVSKTHEVTVFCENEGEAKRFDELVRHEQKGMIDRIRIVQGYLHHGFVWGEEGAAEKPLAFVAHHELFHRYEHRRRVKKVINSRPVDSFLDLKVGDYVVHVAHGIAKFTGMQTITKEGRQEEYLTLRFAENATLHVPAARINLIQKYIGGFHGHPQLSRLGSGAWEKQKARVSESVMDLAAELIEVQSARESEAGTAVHT